MNNYSTVVNAIEKTAKFRIGSALRTAAPWVGYASGLASELDDSPTAKTVGVVGPLAALIGSRGAFNKFLFGADAFRNAMAHPMGQKLMSTFNGTPDASSQTNTAQQQLAQNTGAPGEFNFSDLLNGDTAKWLMGGGLGLGGLWLLAKAFGLGGGTSYDPYGRPIQNESTLGSLLKWGAGLGLGAGGIMWLANNWDTVKGWFSGLIKEQQPVNTSMLANSELPSAKQIMLNTQPHGLTKLQIANKPGTGQTNGYSQPLNIYTPGTGTQSTRTSASRAEIPAIDISGAPGNMTQTTVVSPTVRQATTPVPVITPTSNTGTTPSPIPVSSTAPRESSPTINVRDIQDPSNTSITRLFNSPIVDDKLNIEIGDNSYVPDSLTPSKDPSLIPIDVIDANAATARNKERQTVYDTVFRHYPKNKLHY